ncbi:MdtA/MuxA family multidrug efflux RND transporter periplasmic adaptor subunit [Pseudomonas sp. LS44]|uniref:MdtA/MuxA family multidrug efflux RND transporter periplasmic adaptor subunit n=1 Tax=Pseudomonas sp. LS44 TaxID=1357074 RepID=UPI00215B61D1|nr:MdtA/MuxA family multidrug efflux RND transporter periplasmic adaptor subunit [Pseudomonas sp. LS44]UVE19639.1 MdtA/MuxA family multidrug efflux RND transporter periplasmic adaptor subunit [Pseudomonas sp. LS44]
MAARSPNTPESRSSRRWLFIGLTVLALALLAWWQWPTSKSQPGDGATAEQAAQPGAGRRRGAGAPGMAPGPGGGGGFGGGFMGGPTPVRIAAASQGDFPVYYKALGTVTAMNTVNVRGRVDGQLVKLLFEEGQLVKAGAVLAVIDPRPFQVALQQAQGTLQENQAQLRNAELDLKRYKGLFEEDSIAKQTLDTQEALVNQYRGTIKGNEAAVAQARLNLDFTQVKAPISGRLGLRQVDAGNLVSSGDTTPLVVITQTQPISVSFTLPERDLPDVVEHYRSGQPMAVEAWDRGETRLQAEGVLHSLDNQIDTTTGTLKLKARFTNEKETLFPNQFVNVKLRADTLKNAVLVPTAAVQFGTDGSFVYVLDGDKKVHIRQLQIGPNDGERSVVLSGLKAGDRVVLEGTDRLRDGSEVEIVHDSDAVPASPVVELQGSDQTATKPAAREKPDA